MKRTARSFRHLRSGALMMASTMNLFYGTKRLTGNEPKSAVELSRQAQPTLRVVESVG